MSDSQVRLVFCLPAACASLWRGKVSAAQAWLIFRLGSGGVSAVGVAGAREEPDCGVCWVVGAVGVAGLPVFVWRGVRRGFGVLSLVTARGLGVAASERESSDSSG